MKTKKRKTQVIDYKKTQYDIPKFGYKSAFLITGSILIVIILAIILADYFNHSFKIYLLAFVPLTLAGTVSYSQFFIEKKLGFTKKFWLTFSVLFVLSFVIMMFLQI